MKIYIENDADETASNIGMAKALTECIKDEEDLHEIAQHLLIYSEARAKQKMYKPYEYQACERGEGR